MAQRVPEFFPKAAALNVAPRERVCILSAHSGPNATRSGRITFTNYVINVAHFVGGFSDHKGAGDVGAVAATDGAEVDQEELTFSYGLDRGTGVRERRAGAAGDDRFEGEGFGAVGSEPGFEDSADLEFGHSCFYLSDRFGESFFGDRDGVADVGDFGGVFRFAEGFDEIYGGAPVIPRASVDKTAEVGVGDMRGLEGD